MSRFRLLWRLVASCRLLVRLLREPLVPLWVKAIPVLAAVYFVSPVDLIPDLLVGLGEVDDLLVAVLALELFFWLCPAAVKAFHQRAVAARLPYSPMRVTATNETHGEVFDAEWRRD